MAFAILAATYSAPVVLAAVAAMSLCADDMAGDKSNNIETGQFHSSPKRTLSSDKSISKRGLVQRQRAGSGHVRPYRSEHLSLRPT